MKLPYWLQRLLGHYQPTPQPRLTEQKAIAAARLVAEAEGWMWIEPASAQLLAGGPGKPDVWYVVSNAGARGCNVRVTIADDSGEVLEQSFAPR